MNTTARHHHQDLATSQCWELLRQERTGRVAFADASGIQVFPVNYAVHGQIIYFRTSPYGAIGREMQHTPVSFQVDQIDDFKQSGWSVLARGHARPVQSTELLTELWGQQRPEPWAGGLRSMFVAIAPDQVTGRRVYLAGATQSPSEPADRAAHH